MECFNVVKLHPVLAFYLCNGVDVGGGGVTAHSHQGVVFDLVSDMADFKRIDRREAVFVEQIEGLCIVERPKCFDFGI